jgi:hypothetical protein
VQFDPTFTEGQGDKKGWISNRLLKNCLVCGGLTPLSLRSGTNQQKSLANSRNNKAASSRRTPKSMMVFGVF